MCFPLLLFFCQLTLCSSSLICLNSYRSSSCWSLGLHTSSHPNSSFTPLHLLCSPSPAAYAPTTATKLRTTTSTSFHHHHHHHFCPFLFLSLLPQALPPHLRANCLSSLHNWLSTVSSPPTPPGNLFSRHSTSRSVPSFLTIQYSPFFPQLNDLVLAECTWHLSFALLDT